MLWFLYRLAHPQPQRLLGDAKAAVRMLESRGRLLDMQKTLLLCAVALQVSWRWLVPYILRGNCPC